MVSRWVYDLMYRRGAPWEPGPRSELVSLVKDGRLDPGHLSNAIDLGCGSGANAVFLAQHGFNTIGVDFSPVALEKARAAALTAGVANGCRFVEGDLTDPQLNVTGPFELLVDYGTLDDLRGDARAAMARTIIRLAAPASVFLLWCFQADRSSLPWLSMSGPSRIAPGLEPGEEHELFGALFDIERLPQPPVDSPYACYLLTRRVR